MTAFLQTICVWIVAGLLSRVVTDLTFHDLAPYLGASDAAFFMSGALWAVLMVAIYRLASFLSKSIDE